MLFSESKIVVPVTNYISLISFDYLIFVFFAKGSLDSFIKSYTGN